MKIEVKDDISFKPITISIIVESEKELYAIKQSIRCLEIMGYSTQEAADFAKGFAKALNFEP